MDQEYDDNDAVPGGPVMPFVPGGGFDRARAERLRDEAFAAAELVETKLRQGMADRLSPLKSLCAEVQAKQTGQIGIALDRLRRLCERIEAKIKGRIATQRATVYGYMQAAGLPIPTQEQVKYYAATKDLDGSLGGWDAVSDSMVAGTGEGSQTPVLSGVESGVQGGTLAVYPSGSEGTAPQFLTPGPGVYPSEQCGTGIPTVPFPPGVTCENAPPGTVATFIGPVCPDGWAMSGMENGVNAVCYKKGGAGSGGPSPTPGGPGGSTPPGTGEPPDPCPPGYHWEPPATSGMHTPPPQPGPVITDQALSTRSGGPLSGEAGACYPQVNLSIPTGPSQSILTHPSGSLYTYPWTLGGERILPYATECMEIDGCHGTPPGPGTRTVCFPAGFRLLYYPSTGELIAANGPVPGYNDFVYSYQNGPPGQPPAGPPLPSMPGGAGGTCVPDENCPPLPGPGCGPGVQWADVKPPGRTLDPCAMIEDAVAAWKSATVEVKDIIPAAAHGYADPDGWITSLIGGLSGGQADLVSNLISRFTDFISKTIKESVKNTSCDPVTLTPIAIQKGALDFIEKLTGCVPDQFLAMMTQVSNTICQSNILSQAEADKAYLADELDRKAWECFTKANGNFPELADKVVKAERTRPSVKDLVDLRRRDYISTEHYNKHLRELGVIDDQDKESIWNLSEQWPTFSDLIRFMVRDAFDPKAVELGNLDDGFPAETDEAFKKYSHAAGVSRDLARYFWRAHWEIPSYTQLREMLFRLRPGEVDPKLAVDLATVEKALRQDDYAPAWVPRLIETAYHPLTRTDSAEQYMNRQSSDEQFTRDLMDGGYKKEVAERLKEQYKKKRRIAEYRNAGYPSLTELGRLYGECWIDEATFSMAVQNVAPTDEQAQIAQEAGELRREINERKKLVQTITKEFRLGLIGESEAVRQLNAEGVDPSCVAGFVRRMKRNAERQPKHIAATQLCKLRKYGLISEQDQYSSLVRLGYDGSDALLATRLCTAEILEKLAKLQEAENKAAAKAAEKATKAAAKNGKAKS